MNYTKPSRLVGATSGVAASLMLLIGGGSMSIEAVGPPEEGSLFSATPFVSEAGAPLAPGSPQQSENAPVGILKGRSSITRSSDPLWVSAETATTPDGEVDWALLGEHARWVFESVAEQPPVPLGLVDQMPEASGVFYETAPDGETIAWLRYGPGSLDDPGGHLETLRQVAETARGIYVGEVVAIEEGFLRGDVGSLLRVRTERVVLSSDEHRISDEFYLFWPEAKFSIGDLNFWKENSVYPDRPATGSRVLVVADRRVPFDAARKLILPRSKGVFVEPAKGGLRVSDRAAVPSGATAPSTLEEVAAELQRLVEEGRGGASMRAGMYVLAGAVRFLGVACLQHCSGRSAAQASCPTGQDQRNTISA